jgi:hypothetical protein
MRVGYPLVAMLPLLIVLSCGGSGGDGPVPEPPDPSINLIASFEPKEPNPVGLDVNADQEAASGNLVTVVIQVTDVDDVFAGGFDLLYDAAYAEFVGHGPGTLLESGGDNPVYLVDPVPAGELTVGVSRSSGAAGGADANGTVPLIRLTFRAKQAGTTQFQLRNHHLANAESPPAPIRYLTWHGGTLVAN